jgi:hypothetical protein
MVGTTWTDEDTRRALEIWAEYQSCHDITDQIGQAVGIAPSIGRDWFGSDATDVARKRDAEGVDSQLYVLRVGRDYYLLKRSSRRRVVMDDTTLACNVVPIERLSDQT